MSPLPPDGFIRAMLEPGPAVNAPKAKWSEFTTLIVAGAFFLICWVAFAIADAVTPGPRGEFEESILRAWRQSDDLHKLAGPAWMEEAARDLTGMGGATVLTVVSLLVLVYFLMMRRPAQALLITIAVGGGTVLSAMLKIFFGRERPSVVPHLTTISDASFPSGHAMLSSVVYLTLGALLAQVASRRREHIFFIHTGLLLTVLVGVSRTALGVHYPTDVLAGWTAGTAWALLCWTLARWWRRTSAVAVETS